LHYYQTSFIRGLMNLQKQSAAALRKRRNALVRLLPPFEIYSARLPDRALQTLRQAGMQVCRWARTWTKVLSLGKLPRPAAANGLRAAGSLWANSGVSRQLSQKPRDSGNDLRDQPGTFAPPRGAIERHHERVIRRRPRHYRCGIGKRVSRQHARSLDRRRPAEFFLCGGSR